MTFGQRARAGDIDRPSGGAIGMLVVRPASFGRREKPSRRPDPPTETEDSSHSPTDSRSGTPEADRIVKSNFVEKTEPKPIMTDRQFGWLQKKHHRCVLNACMSLCLQGRAAAGAKCESRRRMRTLHLAPLASHARASIAYASRSPLLDSQLLSSVPCRSGGWAKRYFYVDETRGTLSYAKSVMSVTKKVIPSAVLPLADVTSIEALDNDPCTFVIKCPPLHLTVAAISPKEAKVWMTQLELRAQVWREKQNAKQPVATAEMLQAMIRRSASGAGAPTLKISIQVEDRP